MILILEDNFDILIRKLFNSGYIFLHTKAKYYDYYFKFVDAAVNVNILFLIIV